jgi:hypothetical protein
VKETEVMAQDTAIRHKRGGMYFEDFEINKAIVNLGSRLDVSKGSSLAWSFIGSVLGTALVAAVIKYLFESVTKH